MTIYGIIPARYASTRFPGKPLADINGISMIRRVYEQASKSALLEKVIVATDDQRIYDHVACFGGLVSMTSSDHQSGTSRCFEVIKKITGNPPEVVINIQGDEPFIDPLQIDKIAGLFANESVQIATLIKKITSPNELFNPNVVKVVTGNDHTALYFSRWPIPFLRGEDQQNWLDKTTFFKHIGIYAYRTTVLAEIVNFPPSKLEAAESLEQLRWIENGKIIHTAETDLEGFAVDTPEDLAKIINI
jgi:3-deoxy-manno-octulosonate cytidylyltransferase (CMP-KDO synthetase)